MEKIAGKCEGGQEIEGRKKSAEKLRKAAKIVEDCEKKIKLRIADLKCPSPWGCLPRQPPPQSGSGVSEGMMMGSRGGTGRTTIRVAPSPLLSSTTVHGMEHTRLVSWGQAGGPGTPQMISPRTSAMESIVALVQ